MSRLFIVSNRLPFTLERKEEGISVRQSSGGLVSAIKSYFENNDEGTQAFDERLWVGSMDASEEEWEEALAAGHVQADFGIVPIFPQKEQYELYYNGFSNSTIWPLFHYFPSIVSYKKEGFEAYKAINKLFADKIVSMLQPGDVVWVHDYQLMLLPQMIRQSIPEATIGFFLHIPFPSYEIYRLMPAVWKKAVLEGVLGADLVGFHTHDYMQHFIQSAKMVLKVESQFSNIQYSDRLIKTDLFPIGIHYQRFREACYDETVVGIGTSLEEKFYNQKIIFSVDRLDYTKGLNYRLDGYEEFLNRYPQWREKVVFILNVIPSRDLIPTYMDRKRMIEEKISTINGRFSTLHWQPLIYRYNHLLFEELCALYQVADVALITPLRDGMNLVAKEYIASCIDKGVLILSELTGAASELSEALLVNPTDIDDVADSISTALNMSLVEQRSRLSYMQRRLANYDVFKWINDFMDCLMETKKEQEGLKVNLLRNVALAEIQKQYREGEKRCILLDYDGTLAPYQKIPSMATPGEDLLQLLKELADDEKNEVVIISGRDAETLDRWLGHLPLTMVAEHGASTKLRGGEWKEHPQIQTEWKEQIRPIMQLFVNRCAGSFIEEKHSTLAWHYRNTEADLGFNRSRELRNSLLQMTGNTSLQVIDGNKVLEVRTVGIDKGATAQQLVNYFKPNFILCMGDDTTDEDMFRLLRDKAVTIKVGRSNTAAEFTIPSQKDVFPLLQGLLMEVKKNNTSAQPTGT